MLTPDLQEWTYDGCARRLAAGSRAGILASTLAWAARRGVPFDLALLSLTEQGLPRDALRRRQRVWAGNWDGRLVQAVLDLRDGLPLHQALRQRLGRFLPAHFLLGVEQAENAGRLATVLPCFARRLNLVADRQVGLWRGMRPPTAGFAVLSLLLLWLVTFIWPRLAVVCRELSPEKPLPVSWALTVAVVSTFTNPYVWLGLALVGAVAVISGGRLWLAAEGLLLYLPIVGRLIEQDAMLEVASGMGSFLACGEDVARAGEFCRYSTRRPWLRRRLTRFTADVASGKSWIDAWDGLRLGKPLHRWLIRNAVAREDPVDGFDALLTWLVEEFSETSRALSWSIRLAGLTVNGLLVAMATTAVMGALTDLIRELFTW